MPNHEPRDTDELWTKWAAEAARVLKGRTITSVRYLTRDEATQFGWGRRCVVLTLDNGNFVVPQSDDEGNDAGVLVVIHSAKKETLLPVL